MSLRSLFLLLLVALGAGAAWFYYERQRVDEEVQSVSATAPGEAPPSAEESVEAAGEASVESAPRPAPQVRAEAAVEAPAETETAPERSAGARVEADFEGQGDVGGGVQSRRPEAASSVAGEQGRVKGEAAAIAPAPPGILAPPGGATVKGEVAPPPSADVTAPATPAARTDEGTVAPPSSEVAAAAPSLAAPEPAAGPGARGEAAPEDEDAASTDQPTITEGASELAEPAPSDRSKTRPGEGVLPAPGGERERDPVRPEPGPATHEDGERAPIAALPGDRRQPESGVAEPEPGAEALSTESIRRALSAITGGSDQPLPEQAEGSAEPTAAEPQTTPEVEHAAPAAEREPAAVTADPQITAERPAAPAATGLQTTPDAGEAAAPRERDQAARQAEQQMAPQPPAESTAAPSGVEAETAAPAPEGEPKRTEEAPGATARAEEPRRWWGWLSPERLREALAGLFGGAESEGRAGPSSEDRAVARAVEQPDATEEPAAAGQPESTPDQAATVETPGESLSIETIRRALAALVGGDEPPAPAAGPRESEPEPEIVEPEPATDQEVVEPDPVKPTFDIVRINRDRTAIIAGRAEPDADIEVVVGDRVIDRVQADRRGQWVSTPFEPLEPGDREMTVVARLEDGARIESEQVVVVAVPEPPPPQPPAVAAAEPPPPQPPPSAHAQAPPPQPARTAASEAPPPQPPARTTADAPEPTQTARAEAADEAVAVLLPRDGAGGGRVLQAPGRISNDGELALMVVDYDEEGKTRVSGEAPPGAPVRIYVDNRRAADVVSAASGEWQAVLEDELAPGTYTLRLDQLGAGGKPVARLETPFERVSQPPVAGRVAVDYVVVQPGNSLWRIARRLFGEGIKYVHIYEANQAQIRDPDLIYPGQVFEVPKDLQVAG